MKYVTPPGKSPVLVWLYAGMVMTFIMVAIGGATRLTDSGLSITEWDVVKGSIPPLSAEDWHEAFEKYKRIPQYEHKNPDMTLEGFKRIYWWEWGHRFWGRLIGLVFFVPFVWFLRKKYLRPKMVFHSVMLMLLGGLQGFLGWFMVKSGLEGSDLTSVSHYRLAIHLCMAFITISYLFMLTLNIRFENVRPAMIKYPGYLNLLYLVIGLLAVQIVYGAFTAGLDAGHASSRWPAWSDDRWWPFWNGNFRDLVDNPAWVQFIHRSFAYVVTASILILELLKGKLVLRHSQKKASRWMLLMLVLQFTLGVFTVMLEVPLLIALLHQLGALLLLLSVLYYLHRLTASN